METAQQPQLSEAWLSAIKGSHRLNALRLQRIAEREKQQAEADQSGDRKAA